MRAANSYGMIHGKVACREAAALTMSPCSHHEVDESDASLGASQSHKCPTGATFTSEFGYGE